MNSTGSPGHCGHSACVDVRVVAMAPSLPPLPLSPECGHALKLSSRCSEWVGGFVFHKEAKGIVSAV